MDDIETLRVRNWTDFESHRTRHMRNINSIRVPNLDTEGYIDLISHENGAEHFGAWVAILRVASKCNPRGTLVRDNGSPYTAASLARMTRMPVAIFDGAIPRLIEIGWLEVAGSAADARLAKCGIYKEDEPNGTMPEPSRTVSGSDSGWLPNVIEEERTNDATAF
jgi:hypothetical protein